MSRDSWIRNSLCVASAGPQALHVLTTVYPESDALNPGGQVLHHMLAGEGLTQSVLGTGSPLAAMWRSPQGHLWLGSADGSAWTTAPVAWPPTGPSFEASSAGSAWTTTQLPPLAGSGCAPNVTAVWGTSDSDVFLATASGSIYRWDGARWRETACGSANSLTKLHGTAPDDVYAVGYRGTIAHWNGNGWVLMPTPDIASPSTIVTGIAALESGKAFAVTNRGELLHRTDAGFTTLEKAQGVRFTGLATLASGLVMSSATGAWMHDGQRLQHVKANFSATDVQAVGDRLYFIETEQPQGPACVEYLAARPAGSPWQRVVF